jgi:hypothetical protein
MARPQKHGVWRAMFVDPPFQSPSADVSFGRSKPTITSPSTTVTGVVITPSSSSSAIAVSSIVTSRSTNAMLRSRRNSFTRLQKSQPGCENTVTFFGIDPPTG